MALPAFARFGVQLGAHSSRRLSRFAFALLATVLLFNHRAVATNYYWDLNGTSGGAGTTPTGTWNTALTNWDLTADGTGAATAWVTANTAFFSAGADATTYTVTVSGAISAVGIVVEEGTLTLSGTASPALSIAASGIVVNSTVTGTTTLDASLGNITLNPTSSSPWQNNSSQTFDINAGIRTNGNSKTLTLNGTGTGSTNFNGVLADNGSGVLAVNVGAGVASASTVTLAVANTYSGLTTLNNANGTLLITGSNNSAGATTVSAGTLQLGNASNGGLASGTLTLSTGAILQAVNADRTLSNNVVENGDATISGSQSLTINGSYTNSGAGRTLTNSITGVGKSLTLGNLYLSEAAASARTFTITGAGKILLGGTIANVDPALGAGTASNLTFNTGFTGTATISGSNTYSGTTTLSTGGAFILGNKAAFGTSIVALNGVNISANTDLSGANAIANATVNLGGNNTFTGGNNIEFSGSVAETATRTVTNNLSAGALTLSGNVFLRNAETGTTMTFDGSGVTAITGTIANNNAGNTVASNITYSGAGTLTLSGTNTYTGITTISSGVLSVATLANGGVSSNIGASPLASGNLVINGGTLKYTGGSVTIDRGLNSGAGGGSIEVTNGATNLELDGGVSGNNASFLDKTGAGTLTLGGTGSGATLSMIADGGTIVLAKVGLRAIRGNGGVIINNGATVQLGTAGTGGDQILDSLGAGGVTVNSGTFDLNSKSETINGLQIGNAAGSTSGSIISTGGSGVLTSKFTYEAKSGSASAVLAGIDGTVGLNKTTGGTVILSGVNTYTGPTSVNGGTLEISGSIGASTIVNVNSTGTMLLSGTVTNTVTTYLGDAAAVNLGGGALRLANTLTGTSELAGALAVTQNSIIDFGNGVGNGNALQFTTLTLGGQFLDIYNWSGTRYSLGQSDPGSIPDAQDRLLFSSNPATDPSTNPNNLAQIRFFSDNGITSVGTGGAISFGGGFEVVPVPEPSSAGLLVVTGLLGYLGYRGRGRREGLAHGAAGCSRETR